MMNKQTALLRYTHRFLVRRRTHCHQELPAVAASVWLSSTRHLSLSKAHSPASVEVLAANDDLTTKQSLLSKQENIPEAEIVAETSEHDDDTLLDDGGGDDDDDDGGGDDDDDYFLRDWYGSTPDEAYRRIIDAARLTAEIACEQNGAMVGALAEAGGDEGAAERWLLGFLSLLQDKLPSWWDADSSQQHREALMALANNRNGDYFIKRCVDPLVLMKRLGKEEYELMETVAIEVLLSIRAQEEPSGEEEDLSFSSFSKNSLAEAKAIWGEETMKELTKKTPEELDAERQTEGMLQKLEEGEWWGPATNELPEEAYRRLIDAVRRGTLLAHEQRAEFVGALADALEEQGAQEDIDETDEDAAKDITYQPEELGPNAKKHFEGFLKAMKDTKLMPPWWNQEHEAALWRLGSDMDGNHFLGYPMDGTELKEQYDGGVRHKLQSLAEAAAASMDGDGHVLPSSFDHDMNDILSEEMENIGNEECDDVSDIMSDDTDGRKPM